MSLPWVSRLAFDLVCAERDRLWTRLRALEDVLVSMRRDGFSATKPARIVEQPDIDANALERAEAPVRQRLDDAEFVRNMTADIVRRTGASEAQARAEAIRMRKQVTDEDAPV